MTETHASRARKKVTYVAKSELPMEGFVRKPTVLNVLGVSNTTLHYWIKSGKAPKGILLSPRCRVWPVAEIRALLSKIEEEAAA